MRMKYSEPMTDDELAEIKALEALGDDAIDFSDAPEVLDWTGAVRGKYADRSARKAKSSNSANVASKIIVLPEPVARIYRAVRDLERDYPQRKFTPDGHLVGSIGEVVAAEALKLTLYAMGRPGHDAFDQNGDVQIKMTAGRSVAMHATSDRLVVLRVVSPEEAEIVYDGPGQPAWDQAGKLGKNGQRVISLTKLRAMAAE